MANKMKYLLIEDDEIVAPSCKRAATSVGLEAHFHHYKPTAENKEQLLKINRELSPQIVQLDGLEGSCFPLIERLKTDNPNAAYFVCSGSYDILEEAKAKQIRFFEKGTGNLIVYLAELKRELETTSP